MPDFYDETFLVEKSFDSKSGFVSAVQRALNNGQ